MIDIENIVFNNVATALRNKYGQKNISVYGDYVETPTSFPCVCLYEEDNYTYAKTQDENQENDIVSVFTLYVYCNKADGKKSQAKEITDLVDEEMNKMLYTRTFRNQIPNTDRTIYRIAARYRAVVHKGVEVGNNTVYHIYRN